MNRVKRTDWSRDQDLFKDVVFLVEADDFARQVLLERVRTHRPDLKSWQQVMEGRIVTIGYLGKRPICVSLFYAVIDGKRVMFFSACSMLVDHQLVEDWLRAGFKPGLYFSSNAMNFHNCVQALARMSKEKP